MSVSEFTPPFPERILGFEFRGWRLYLARSLKRELLCPACERRATVLLENPRWPGMLACSRCWLRYGR